MKTHAPIHPGEILREDFLIPLGISEYRVAKDIGVPPRRINEIVKGKRALTVDTALRSGPTVVSGAFRQKQTPRIIFSERTKKGLQMEPFSIIYSKY
jgi:addiction module HigA family antidote